jgi:alkylation response protein AidB-like acyl-CoA dehydrogenase
MDFELNEDQRAIAEAVEALLRRHAGPARAIALQPKAEYDAALEAALAEAGFLDVARGAETGPLEAALVTEAVARAAGVVSVGAAALVAPAVMEEPPVLPVAVAQRGERGLVRYAAQARTLLVLDGDGASVVALSPGDAEPVPSNTGYPMGRIGPERLAAADRRLGPGSGTRLRDWWRLSIVVETAGAMRAALDETVAYVKERRQFGRAIGSFQAVQHRLAECAVAVEGSRWLALEAAWRRAPTEAVATAAAYALAAAGRVFRETHQLTGAIGFTREHDLHVWSMRLQALRLELGGLAAHRHAVVSSRWGAA